MNNRGRSPRAFITIQTRPGDTKVERFTLFSIKTAHTIITTTLRIVGHLSSNPTQFLSPFPFPRIPCSLFLHVSNSHILGGRGGIVLDHHLISSPTNSSTSAGAIRSCLPSITNISRVGASPIFVRVWRRSPGELVVSSRPAMPWWLVSSHSLSINEWEWGSISRPRLAPSLPRFPSFTFVREHNTISQQRSTWVSRELIKGSHRSLRPPSLAQSSLWHLQHFHRVRMCCYGEQPRISDRCLLSNRVISQGECRHESVPDLPEFFCQ